VIIVILFVTLFFLIDHFKNKVEPEPTPAPPKPIPIPDE
jgi:hypothetical protein